MALSDHACHVVLQVSLLQSVLTSDYVGSPLTWTLPPASTSKMSAPEAAHSKHSQSQYMRATWLPIQYNCTSAESVKTAVEQLYSNGVTRIYVDVWNNGVAYFNSPTLKSFAGDDSVLGNDVLAWTLAAAALLNVQVLAWFEYGLMASYGDLSNKFASVADSRGLILGQADNFFWLDGRKAEVQQLLLGMLVDAQAGYGSSGLMGVQLDDHFAFPVALGGSAADMTSIMQTIHNGFHARFPSSLFSLSPATVDMALQKYAVDWVSWMNADYFSEVTSCFKCYYFQQTVFSYM
jgi:uncharacterized lipoprotein YddW (UPF0748 family)